MQYKISQHALRDRFGNNSRQCDIIIYDNYYYPEILSLSSVHLFPVDFVYATIEVKTTLNSKSAEEAIENIISTRKLKYIEESFRVNPSEPVTKFTKDTILFETKSTNQPLGIIFGYRSEARKFDTFANWFYSKDDKNNIYWPSHIFCLDQGIIIGPLAGEKRLDMVGSLATGKNAWFSSEDDKVFLVKNKEWIIHENSAYPLSIVGESKVLIDQTKILINFICILDGMLKNKLLSPLIDFRSNYLPEDLKSFFLIKQIEE